MSILKGRVSIRQFNKAFVAEVEMVVDIKEFEELIEQILKGG